MNKRRVTNMGSSYDIGDGRPPKLEVCRRDDLLIEAKGDTA